MQAEIKGTTMPVLEVTLEPGEQVISTHGELSWMTPNIQMSQRLFLVALTGPGQVWLQSMPLPALAHALEPCLAQSADPQAAQTGAVGGIIGDLMRGQ